MNASKFPVPEDKRCNTVPTTRHNFNGLVSECFFFCINLTLFSLYKKPKDKWVKVTCFSFKQQTKTLQLCLCKEVFELVSCTTKCIIL